MNIIQKIFSNIYSSFESFTGKKTDLVEWFPNMVSDSEAEKDSWEHEISVARCRQIADSDVLSGAVKREGFNVVQNGITVKTPDEEFNKSFALWSKIPSFFDFSGDCTLRSFLKLIVRAWRTDGEAFIIDHYYKTGFDVPLCFELVPVDALDATRDNSDDIIRGIRYDKKTGRKKAYFFIDEDTLQSREIPAENVIHAHLKKAIGRRRGSPTLAPSAVSTRDMRQYISFERLAAKVHSCITFFLKTDSPEAYRQLRQESKIPFPRSLQPGRLFTLPSGTSVENSGQQRPTNTFQPFTQSILQLISSSINHAYPNFSGDYARSSYSAARMATIEERIGFKDLQKELIDQVISPILYKYARACQISGLLATSIDLYSFVYQETIYLPPGFEVVDPLKKAKSLEILVDKKIRTLTNILGDEGIDFAKHMDQLKLEAQEMLELETIYAKIRELKGEN